VCPDGFAFSFQGLLSDAGGVRDVVRCLGRGSAVAKFAAALLLELSDKNETLSTKIGQERSAILLLVTLLSSKDEEAAEIAGMTLSKLSDLNDNVVRMADANWCGPLITRLCAGLPLSFLLTSISVNCKP
jgi:hypothetical protein